MHWFTLTVLWTVICSVLQLDSALCAANATCGMQEAKDQLDTGVKWTVIWCWWRWRLQRPTKFFWISVRLCLCVCTLVYGGGGGGDSRRLLLLLCLRLRPTPPRIGLKLGLGAQLCVVQWIFCLYFVCT